MKINQQRPIGKTDLQVTQLGLGCLAFGNNYDAISDQDATHTVNAAFEAGVGYFDTAPLYGFGLSETRLGNALAGQDRSSYVLSSKVGFLLEPQLAGRENDYNFIDPLPYDPILNFSRDGILRSFDDSLNRLGLDAIDIVYIHDPDGGVSVDPSANPYEVNHGKQVLDEAFPALAELREQGVIKAIGVGLNQWQMLVDFAKAADFDCFLLANRYTLLDQSAFAELLPICEEKNISLVIGGPYNSGILASGAVEGAYYNYVPATPEILQHVGRIEAVCARHEISLQAAALQFPFGHPAIASVIPGARSAAEIYLSAEAFREDIPADFWAELKAEHLLDENLPVP